ncbi:Uncharacterised protein [Corynebacterium diphtheriae]|nr:Uncharacterised protein [Corynebacterium diphtheriae]
MTSTASGSSSTEAVLKPENPSIATTSMPSRQSFGRVFNHCLNTCFDRPGTMSSRHAGPASWPMQVRSRKSSRQNVVRSGDEKVGLDTSRSFGWSVRKLPSSEDLGIYPDSATPCPGITDPHPQLRRARFIPAPLLPARGRSETSPESLHALTTLRTWAPTLSGFPLSTLPHKKMAATTYPIAGPSTRCSETWTTLAS